MHDLYPQKQPPTLSAITWGFVIATFLPPVVLCWYAASHSPDMRPADWWPVIVTLFVSVATGIFLGCWISSDLPVGCAILVSPLIPMVLWFVFAIGTQLWEQERPFSRMVASACLVAPGIALLSTPTAGVFVLTRWLVKGRA